MSVTVERLSAEDAPLVLNLPSVLYADDPCWVPPLRAWEGRRLARAAADPGRMALFVARRGGSVVGTISASREQPPPADPASKPVRFGYFESIDDPAVASALVSAAAEQARAWGGRRLLGPMNLSRFEFVGLAVSGLDTLPPLMQAQHRPYYSGLLEATGLTKHHDVFAYSRSLVAPSGLPSPLPPALLEKAGRCQIPGLEIRAARRLRLGRDIEDVFTVLNEAYATVPDISPMSRATFMGLGRAMFALAGPGLIQIAAVEGRPVGFAVCIPELNEALVSCRGRLLPLGWARLLGGLGRIETAAFKLIGVLPSCRGSGLHAALIAAVIRGAQAAGYRRVDGSVIDERNQPMRRVVEGAGLSVYRTYRFYGLGL